jgi:hypothetical protein
MKLNKEQINQVKNFISKRGFTYYDVQLEIIDHVACKVEDLMTADPGLSLDEAIAQTHAGFGVMGFSVVEDAMRASLQKRYWKQYSTAFGANLQLKFLPLIAGFIYVVYMINKIINAPVILFNATWILVFLLVLIWFIVTRKDQQKHKRMLSAQMGGIAAIVINVPLQLYINVNSFTKSGANLNVGVAGIILGAFLTLMILSAIALINVQKAALENCRELEEQYQLTVGA